MADSKRLHSAVWIARVLGTEGFTDYTANLCVRWWRKNKKRVNTAAADGVKKQFSEMLQRHNLTDDDKKILGAFIKLRSTQCFDTGFAIGYQVYDIKQRQPFWKRLVSPK